MFAVFPLQQFESQMKCFPAQRKLNMLSLFTPELKNMKYSNLMHFFYRWIIKWIIFLHYDEIFGVFLLNLLQVWTLLGWRSKDRQTHRETSYLSDACRHEYKVDRMEPSFVKSDVLKVFMSVDFSLLSACLTSCCVQVHVWKCEIYIALYGKEHVRQQECHGAFKCTWSKNVNVELWHPLCHLPCRMINIQHLMNFSQWLFW